MAGQGATTSLIARTLRDAAWTVVYTCLPNTPHVGVVPIPTKGATTAQRYPDILAFKNSLVSLTEVEIRLTPDIYVKAIERFREQRTTLADGPMYRDWAARIGELLGFHLPTTPVITCDLVLCNRLTAKQLTLMESLAKHQIRVVSADAYTPVDDA